MVSTFMLICITHNVFIHQIILDVQDFATGGVITVKIVNEKEVVVEGRIEKKEVTTKRFCRRFVLSQEIHVETVSCVMSADGVLVITAPRKVSDFNDVRKICYEFDLHTLMYC